MISGTQFRQVIQLPVVVAALGYFVDIYDLLLFSIIRIPSLTALGLKGDALLKEGIHLINIQMVGMLIGGALWGILGDRKGRLSVLFGSILLYSLANLANAFVTNLDQYAILRFIAGVGLAGELGAGITLVAEMLPKEIRGFGTSLVASFGLLGAVLAYVVAEWFEWRIAYGIGGGLGLGLLLLRVGVFESGLFTSVQQKDVKRGNFMSLFAQRKRFFKYLRCILIGLPIWFVIGILVTFSPEFGKALGLPSVISAGKAVMFLYLGQSTGDLTGGFLSQYLRSRKKVILFFLLLTSVTVVAYLTLPQTSAVLYGLCYALGFAIGYWALFVTVAAEQFGTNLRATVATTVPNLVRATVIPLTLSFVSLSGKVGTIRSGLIIGAFCIIVAALALWKMEETFESDLDFVETE